jgi:hypothetical protein
MNIYEKMLTIQTELKAPKNQFNSFGNYNYRSCEDIQEGVKPLLKSTNTVLTVTDEMLLIGDRFYVKATATLHDCESVEKISNVGYAREELNKKGMDASQITGSASSYARKYALNGLFCIDDVKDADNQKPEEKNNTDKQQPAKTKTNNNSEYKCEKCGLPFTDFEWKGKAYTAKQGYEIAQNKCNGTALCNKCKKEAGL